MFRLSVSRTFLVGRVRLFDGTGRTKGRKMPTDAFGPSFGGDLRDLLKLYAIGEPRPNEERNLQNEPLPTAMSSAKLTLKNAIVGAFTAGPPPVDARGPLPTPIGSCANQTPLFSSRPPLFTRVCLFGEICIPSLHVLRPPLYKILAVYTHKPIYGFL